MRITLIKNYLLCTFCADSRDEELLNYIRCALLIYSGVSILKVITLFYTIY